MDFEKYGYTGKAKKQSYARLGQKRRKHQLVLALGGACRLCGYNKCDRALDFHHINEKDKQFYIGQRLWLDLPSLLKEVKKCVLLCSNCHREVHDGMSSLEGITPIFDETIQLDFILKPNYSGSCLNCKKVIHGKRKYCCNECYMIGRYGRYVAWETVNLKKMMKDGFTVKEIANFLNVSEGVVRDHARKVIGTYIPKKFWPPVSEILEMLETQSYLEVGRKLGSSDNGVRKYLRRTLGYAPRKRASN